MTALEKATISLPSVAEQLEVLQSQLQLLERKTTLYKTENADLKQQLAQMMADNQHIVDENEKQTKMTVLSCSLYDAVSEELDELQSEKATLSSDIGSLQASRKKFESEKLELYAQLAQYQSVIQTLQKKVGVLEKKDAERIKIIKELDQALETMLAQQQSPSVSNIASRGQVMLIAEYPGSPDLDPPLTRPLLDNLRTLRLNVSGYIGASPNVYAENVTRSTSASSHQTSDSAGLVDVYTESPEKQLYSYQSCDTCDDRGDDFAQYYRNAATHKQLPRSVPEENDLDDDEEEEEEGVQRRLVECDYEQHIKDMERKNQEMLNVLSRVQRDNKRLKARLERSWEFCITPSFFSHRPTNEDDE